MTISVVSVIDEARDFHAALSKQNVPDALMVGELRRALDDLINQIFPRVPAFVAVTLEVDLTDPSINWDAVCNDIPGGTGFALESLIPGGWKDPMKGEFWWLASGNVSRRPEIGTFVPWEQRTLPCRKPAFTLRNNALYFLGAPALYQHYQTFRLVYTANPAVLQLGDNIPLPDDVHIPLASRLAVFGLRRLISMPNINVTAEMVGPFADQAKSDRAEFLQRVFRTTQRQRYVVNDVRPDPGGPWPWP